MKDKIALKELKELFLEKLPKGGELIRNSDYKKRFLEAAKLKYNQDLTEDDYKDVRVSLKEDGKVVVGRGRGGSVGLPNPTASPIPVSEKDEDERGLYEPIHRWIEDTFTKEKEGINANYISAITADIGKRDGAGIWTCPDITLVAVHTFETVPNKQLTVATFEVKRTNDFDIKGVFEAAAHMAFSHRSYLTIKVTERAELEDEFARIKAECYRLGVGLITLEDKDNPDTYEQVIDPRFHNPDWAEVDRFLRRALVNPKDKDKLLRKLGVYIHG
jgi:hypothetical protein